VKARETGHLHRNFQGYTTHGNCDLIGMGVSSISSVGSIYSQHEKTLDDYYEAVSCDRLPVLRGLQLTKEDQLRRYIIQRLTCYFMLDTVQVGDRFKIDFGRHFAEELTSLATMEEDGLLELSEHQIRVLPKGRLLIRNICMTFDVSLRDKSARQRFSKVI